MFELREDRLESDGVAVLKRDSGLLKDNNIAALAPDSEGRLWVGYFDRGLEIVDMASSKASQHIEDEHVYCVKPDCSRFAAQAHGRRNRERIRAV